MRKGTTHHEETKRKMSQSAKNRGCNNKGFKFSPESLQKLIQSHKGQIPWNKGKIMNEDFRQKARKRRIGQVIPSKDSKPEKIVQESLITENIKFEKHKTIFGQPDIFIEPNLCIFVDGDYWHNLPKAITRDTLVNETLEKQGYKILRFWEHEIYEDIRNVINTIIEQMGYN